MAFLLRRLIPAIRRCGIRPGVAAFMLGGVLAAGYLSPSLQFSASLHCAAPEPIPRPPESSPVLAPSPGASPALPFILGAVIEEEDPKVAKGLKIVIVKPESLAEKFNLKENDVILEVDGMPVKSKEEYRMALIRYATKKKMFKIQRDDKVFTVEIAF